MTRPPRVALVAPYAYPALVPHGTGFDYVGGAEIQQARLAPELARRGFDVWFVTADFGQPPRLRLDGVGVERAYRPFAGIPGLRFFHPRASSIWAALTRVAPDVVYQRTAGALTGVCAAWARAHRRPFVFACAHDYDTLPASPALGNPRDRWLYHWGLTRADRILVQGRTQAESLRAHHGLDATIVRNMVPLPPAPRREEEADRVLWLGTVKAAKRPGWILEAARALPEVRFTIAGGPPPRPDPGRDNQELAVAAAALPNVEMMGFVPPARVSDLWRRTRVFVHTSPAEGFPNTLLEAWAHGVPSVSALDPDGAIAAGAGGLVAEDPAGLTAAIAKLWHDPIVRADLGARARAYVVDRHAPDVVGEALADVLLDVLGRTADDRAAVAAARAG